VAETVSPTAWEKSLERQRERPQTKAKELEETRGARKKLRAANAPKNIFRRSVQLPQSDRPKDGIVGTRCGYRGVYWKGGQKIQPPDPAGKRNDGRLRGAGFFRKEADGPMTKWGDSEVWIPMTCRGHKGWGVKVNLCNGKYRVCTDCTLNDHSQAASAGTRNKRGGEKPGPSN